MYKLLPQENKDLISREYSLRRFVVALILLSLLLIFSTFAALPSLIHVYAKKEAVLLTLTSAEKTSRASDKATLESWVTKIRERMQALAPGVKDNPHGSFTSIVSDKSAGIRITGLTWQKIDGTITAKVRGVATDRQALLGFQNILRGSGEWQEADFPVSALAEDSDIEFELTLKPK